MKTFPKSILVLALFSTFLAGCVRQKVYRTDFQPQPYVANAKNANGVIESTANYSIGYVEFDDQGWLYGTNRSRSQIQVDAVVNRLADEAKTNGLVIVTFVHGWNIMPAAGIPTSSCSIKYSTSWPAWIAS